MVRNSPCRISCDIPLEEGDKIPAAYRAMFADVERKLKKGNAILFSRGSECLQPLLQLIQIQNHRTLVLWALDCAEIPLARFEAKYPNESRPRAALELCDAWSRGEVKMPAAKRAILDAHAAAKKIDDAEYAALCHAIGQAGATVHVETHAVGLPFYELTALVHRFGKEGYQQAVMDKISYYCERLNYWQENADKVERKWAGFLLDDRRINKKN